MSTLKADTIQSTSGGAATLTKQSAAKAWAVFNTGATSSLDGSFNTSSLVDNGTGDHTISWTNSFSGTRYSGGNVCSNSNVSWAISGTLMTASDVRGKSYTLANNIYDPDITGIVFHGDLA